MRGKTSVGFPFNAKIKKTLHARLRQARLAKLELDKEQPIVHSESEKDPERKAEEKVRSVHSDSDSETETMVDDPPPPARLIGDYGDANASGGRLTIVNQSVNVPNFQMHPSTTNQLERKPFTKLKVESSKL